MSNTSTATPPSAKKGSGASTKPPKLTASEPECEITASGILLRIHAYLRNENGKAIRQKEVVFKTGTTVLGGSQRVTDITGEATLQHVFPPTDQDQVKNIRITSPETSDKVDLMVHLPKIIKPSKNPQRVNIEQIDFEQSSKKFTVKVRLMKEEGFIIPGQNIVFLIRDKIFSVPTNDDGYVCWEVPADMAPQKDNDEVELIATTDGIEEKMYDFLALPPKLNNTNNIFALTFLAAMVFWWIVCWIVGINADWKEILWTVIMVFSNASVAYFFWAYKEELGYQLKKGYRKVRSRFAWSAGDPIVERIIKYIEKHQEHKEKILAAVGVPKSDETFVERVAANMTGEVILETLAGFGKRIFKMN